MRIKTTLVDVNGEHFTEATSTVTLTDHVAYKKSGYGQDIYADRNLVCEGWRSH